MRHLLRELFESETVVARRDHPELQEALKALLAGREIESVLPGVYALPDHREFPEVRALALRRYDPDAILLGRAAARFSFWPGLEVREVVAVTRHCRAAQVGYRFVRRQLTPELWTEVDGYRLSVPALTALDLCDEMGGDAIDEVLRRGKATLADLHEAMALIRKQPGNEARRRLLRESSNEPWSAAERLLHRLLREAGIEGWRGNVELTVAGSTYVVDVLFRGERLVIEVDGRHFHGEARFESDRWRQNALVLDGWRVLRATWTMLERYPERVVETVERALAAESPSRRAA
ncbi:MAG TPA: DUF559 domain-containing protein [Microlunatus sp.]